jgi:hypothetical protein
MKHVLNTVVLHQIPTPANDPLAVWSRCDPLPATVALFGGRVGEFEALRHEPRLLAPGARIRTHDHQRERRNPIEAYRALSEWMKGKPYAYVHIVDYDALPLRRDYFTRVIARCEDEDADVLVYHVARIDRTNNPLYLAHSGDPRFGAFWEGMSVRRDRSIVLNALGVMMLWRREAFEAVAAIDEPFPIHGEEYLPTLAHHLGFRVRGIPEQVPFAFADTWSPAAAHEAGAWLLHPVKRWDGEWTMV